MSNVNRLFILTAVLGLCVGLFVQTASAVPPKPGTYDPETLTFYDSGLPIPADITEPGPLRTGMYNGVWRFPVIFILGNDQTANIPVADWQAQLFTLGTHPTGSMRDYYLEVSYGQLDIQGETRGWFTASQPYSYYAVDYGTGPDRRAADLVAEAVDLAEADGMDWSQYDNDGDGYVDGVVVIHGGIGGENGAPGCIWSHVSSMKEEKEYDGVKISQYSIQPELGSASPPTIETIGTICHEHGHVLGLPDLYDVSYTPKIAPIGKLCLMASGSSMGTPMGSKPAHMTAWCRYQMGWLNPVLIDSPGTFTANAIQTGNNNNVYMIPINNSEKEYFMIANRWMGHSMQFDHFPTFPNDWDGGLQIYLVDDNIWWSNNGNNEFWHVAVLDAMPETNHLGDSGFCSDTGNDKLGLYTDPSSRGHYAPSNIYISNVNARGASMSFDVTFFPSLFLDGFSITDLGNKSYSLSIGMENRNPIAGNNVTATLSTESSNVVIDTATANFGNIAANGTGNNDSNPFLFHTTGTDGELVTFTISVDAGGADIDDMTVTLPVNPSRFLIVDDDATRKDEPRDVELYFEDALTRLGYEFETWEVLSLGFPTAEVMSMYELVIWEDGSGTLNTPKPGRGLDEIQAFLDMGGDLFWSSHEFIYSNYGYTEENGLEYVEPEPGSFVRDYLHIIAAEQDEYYFTATGVPGGPYDGLTFDFEDPFDNWWPDEVQVDSECIPMLLAGPHECEAGDDNCNADAADNMIQNGVCAYAFQGEYRLFFMTVPLYGVSADAAAPENRQHLMKRAFEWFGINETTPHVDIDLNRPVFTEGDDFQLTLKVRQEGATVTADTFVFLDVYGTYFFWPSWSQDMDFESITYTQGVDYLNHLLEFTWPSVVGSAADLRVWAGLVNGGQLLGNYDFTVFGYE